MKCWHKTNDSHPAQLLPTVLPKDYVKHIEDVKKKLNVSTAYSLSSGVPKLEVLSNFDVLFVWTASWARDGGATEYDRDKTGNVLADYVEGGGKVRQKNITPIRPLC